MGIQDCKLKFVLSDYKTRIDSKNTLIKRIDWTKLRHKFNLDISLEIN